MKVFVVLASCLAITAALVVPTVPGDNSHYVEGESRYIWIPNGDEVPVLVDLQEPVDVDALKTRNGANNQYWLFTRQNPTTPQIITHGNMNSIVESNFDPSKPIKAIVHGWTGNGNNEINTLITAAYLAREDVNVFVVDWSGVAAGGYLTAVSGVPSVGQHLGNFLIWLVQNTGASWNNIHLAGHSLGAHVVASAGRATAGLIRRITGLDPAGPGWGSSNANTIRPADAVFVEVIHTDSGILGLTEAVGDVDFYPNGGRNPQPGCLLSSCSHLRAYYLFASTIYFDHLTGNRCESLNNALQGQCWGTTLTMGNHDINKWGSGMFHLTTGSSWPF